MYYLSRPSETDAPARNKAMSPMALRRAGWVFVP